MAVPIEPGTAVTIVYAAGAAPVLAHAVVQIATPARLVFTFEDGRDAIPGLSPGGTVVAQARDAGGAHALLRVESCGRGILAGLVERASATDQRAYPRCFGALEVRYDVRRGLSAQELHAWLAGEGAGGSALPYTPDPLMHFSAASLIFDDVQRAVPGDLLLMEIHLPPDTVPHRVSARVVRVSTIPLDERDDSIPATHRIAASFEEIGRDTVAALVQTTVRIQRSYLEGLP
jgi:hypothetical protein